MKAIYSRQSLDKKDSISIETQIDKCKRELNEDDEIRIYIDKGYSGKNTERPQFQQMMSDVKEGLIDTIVVYKLDRISRSLLDFEIMWKVFTMHNVTFISSAEKFDTSTPMGSAMLKITMVFAELERKSIQQRVKDAYYSRGEKGLYMGGRAPYGFQKIDTYVDGKKTYTFEENGTQAEVVREMYNLYSDTEMTLGQVSRYLNEKGIKSAEGKNWDSCKISRILRSPAYVKADAEVYTYYKARRVNICNDIEDFIGENGCYLYGKRESNERKYTNVEDHYLSIGLHEGIIDSDTWIKCQYKMDSNKQIKNSGKGKYTWLSGIMKCKKCGYSISVLRQTNGEKYLACRGRTNHNTCEGFTKHILVENLENTVEAMLKERFNDYKDAKVKVKNKTNQEVNQLKIEATKIEEKIDNYIRNLGEANSTVMKLINEQVDKLTVELNRIQKKIQEYTIKDKKSGSLSKALENIGKWNELDFESKKNTAKALIKEVRIDEDDVIIRWRYEPK